MRTKTFLLTTALTPLCLVCTANAQWITLVNETTTRMPTGAGQNTASTSTTDPEEKDYAWGDVDRDGDTDLICVRKIPFTFEGGKINKLFMNENGILIDRTNTYVNSSINVPGGGSSGFNDLTNDRDVILVDVNNDGWLDMVTAVTLSDGLARYIGHPRVYVNQGSIGGVWQGFVYDYNRIPQLISKPPYSDPANPRFCSVTGGDLDGDGYADLYFGAYDQGDFGPPMVVEWDMDNKLLMNVGTGNPGFFVDSLNTRMSTTLLQSAFGAASIIVDMNGDGRNDVVKQTSLQTPQHIAIKSNNTTTMGTWTSTNHKVVYSLAPYFVSSGDLNNDGRMDLIIADDGTDRYMLNTGNDANGNPNFGTSILVASDVGSELGNSFTGNLVMADLDNDGWKDTINCDVDVDTPGCTRRTRIFRNLGNAPNITLRELSPSVIPTGQLTGIHDIAAMDIDGDGWLDLVLGGCGAGSNSGTKVFMNRPPANLAFSYPSGKPSSLTPGQATVFQVQVTGINGGTPMANSGKVYVVTNTGGAFVEYAMTPLGGNLYQATIPAQLCGDSVRYYVSAQLSTGAVKTDPAPQTGFSVPNTYYSAPAYASTTALIDEDFEGAVSGWNIVNGGGLTSGAWEVAVPNGTWNDGVQAAPGADYSPAGTKCFVTGNGAPGGAVGAASVKGGTTELQSPIMDLNGKNAQVSFAYWYYANVASNAMSLQVSNNNGGSWTTVTSLKGPKIADPNYNPAQPNSWKTYSFVIGDYVTPSSEVRVRLVVNPGIISEAALDEFVVTEFVCAKPPACLADLNNDNLVGTPDLLALINAWGSCPGCPADLTNDGLVGTPDLLALINAWGPCD